MNERIRDGIHNFALDLVKGDSAALKACGIDIGLLGEVGTPEYYQRAIETLVYGAMPNVEDIVKCTCGNEPNPDCGLHSVRQVYNERE